MWRERIRRSGADLFTSFLKLIAEKQSEVTPDEDLPKVYLFFSLFFIDFSVVFLLKFRFISSCCYLQYFVEMNTPLWDCIYCGHPMTNKEDQRIHVQQECEERPPWEDFCPFCGLEFPSKHSLAIHMSRWCKERPARNWCFLSDCNWSWNISKMHILVIHVMSVASYVVAYDHMVTHLLQLIILLLC